jgi:hypothetical protein
MLIYIPLCKHRIEFFIFIRFSFSLTCICSNADDNPQTRDDSKSILLIISDRFIGFSLAFLSYTTTENNSETISQACTTTFDAIKQDTEVRITLFPIIFFIVFL